MSVTIRAKAGNAVASGPTARIANIAPSDGGGVAIPLMASSASLGPGSELLDEDSVRGDLVLSSTWLESNLRGVKVQSLAFIHGYGDSMHPTIGSGDILLVDRSVRECKIDGVYVLQAHGRLFIKRVRTRMLDGMHEVSSDNPIHKTVDVLNGDSEVSVLGRVLWVWNGRKL